MENNAARLSSLYFHYSRQLGYVPEEAVAEAEYIRLGLNKTESGAGRSKRLKEAREWVMTVFTPELGIRLDNWDISKQEILQKLSDVLGDEQRYWNKGKKRYKLTMHDIAIAVYGLMESHKADKINTMSKAYSYKQVDTVFKTITGICGFTSMIRRMWYLILRLPGQERGQ